jgi:hypothetical protein
VARLLIDRGFTRVLPLAGGLDAWMDAGHLIEDDTIVALRSQRTDAS